MSFYQIILVTLVVRVIAENCPQGGDIYSKGISEQGKIDVVEAHNYYRLQIALGNVTKQPKGTDLLRMSYDEVLGLKGRAVSESCRMDHILVKDDRWEWVGQNLYIQRNSSNSSTQNWSRAVEKWFEENVDFIYPYNKTNDSAVVGHYTQVVWNDSKLIGCDFIHFYDASKFDYPYTKLYTCNYGPGGNLRGRAPYTNGTSGCENLC